MKGIGGFGKEREGQCILCCQKKVGVDAAFQDGLKGFLCWKDFRNMVKARSNHVDEPKELNESSEFVDDPINAYEEKGA